MIDKDILNIMGCIRCKSKLIDREDHLECNECNIEPFDLYQADEAFLTATPFCVLPTTHLNGVPIGSGKMGNITKKILELWSKKVGLDIVHQIREYAIEVETLQKSNAPTPYQFRN